MSAPIATIQKNAREEIRIELSEFKGHNLLNMRVWSDKDGGNARIPTKAGIACKVTLLPALISALQKTEAAARAAGLMP
jgi:hypothetical protein